MADQYVAAWMNARGWTRDDLKLQCERRGLRAVAETCYRETVFNGRELVMHKWGLVR